MSLKLILELCAAYVGVCSALLWMAWLLLP